MLPLLISLCYAMLLYMMFHDDAFAAFIDAAIQGEHVTDFCGHLIAFALIFSPQREVDADDIAAAAMSAASLYWYTFVAIFDAKSAASIFAIFRRYATLCCA